MAAMWQWRIWRNEAVFLWLANDVSCVAAISVLISASAAAKQWLA